MSTLQRMFAAFAAVVFIGAVQGFLMLSSLGSVGDKAIYVATKPIVAVDNARAAWSSYRDAQEYLAAFLEMTKHQDSSSALMDFDLKVMNLTNNLDRVSEAVSSAKAMEYSEFTTERRMGMGAESARSVRSSTRDEHPGAAFAGPG